MKKLDTRFKDCKTGADIQRRINHLYFLEKRDLSKAEDEWLDWRDEAKQSNPGRFTRDDHER